MDHLPLPQIAAELRARLQGLVGRVAVIAQTSLIDPQKFGVKVAQNRGLSVDIFHDPHAALRWLLHS